VLIEAKHQHSAVSLGNDPVLKTRPSAFASGLLRANCLQPPALLSYLKYGIGQTVLGRLEQLAGRDAYCRAVHEYITRSGDSFL
jgi:hypothetical protein